MRYPASCGMDLEQALVQDRRRSVDVGRQEARPPAEDHPPVRGHVPVEEEVLGIEECAALGRQLVREVGRERLARDDVAADRDDPSPESRGDPVRVPVGRHEHVPREDRAPVALHDEAAIGLSTDRPGSHALVEVGPGPVGGGGQPGEVPTRVEEAAALDHECAVVGVGADLLADLGARHDRRRHPHRCQARLGVLELGDMRWRIRELEVADLAEVAIDGLIGDEPLDQRVGVERLAVQSATRGLAEPLQQVGRPPLVPGVHDAAVAGRCPPTKRVCLEERRRDAASCKLARRVDAGVPTADHDHVRGVGQRSTGAVGQGRHRCLPEGAALVVAVERGRGGHARSVAERTRRCRPVEAYLLETTCDGRRICATVVACLTWPLANCATTPGRSSLASRPVRPSRSRSMAVLSPRLSRSVEGAVRCRGRSSSDGSSQRKPTRGS